MINTQRNNKIEFMAFDEAMNSAVKEIDKALRTSPTVIRKYTEHLAQSGGKNIRALSVITCAQNEEELIHPNAVKAAASIEIIHLASLVHDDVMDDADMRRGKETLQKKFGKKTAVICGDYLLSLALKLSGSAFNKDDYMDLNIPDYMSRLAMGELKQNINHDNLNLTELEYFKTISGKTAALFEASFYAGAVISKCDDKTLKSYMKLGNYAGMIFQITDDCMDFETTRDVAKKPVQSDIEQGVITLPLIYALKNVGGLKEKITEKEISVNDLRQLVEKSGGLEYTHEVAKKYYDKSKKLIDKLNVPQNKMSRLQLILDKVYRLA
jgi:heptaprenyl diphosphate synthase